MKIFVYFLTNIYWSMIYLWRISVCPEAPKVFFFTVSLSVHAVSSFIPCSIAPSVISCSCSPLSLPLTITAALSFFWPSCFTLLFSITIFQSSLSPHSISSLSFPLHPSIYFSRPHPSGYPVPDILGFLMCVCGHLFVFGAVRRPLCVPDMLFQSTAETFTVRHNKGGLREIYRAITPG